MDYLCFENFWFSLLNQTNKNISTLFCGTISLISAHSALKLIPKWFFPLIFQVRMGAWNVLIFIEIILFSKSWILKHSSSKDFNVFVEWICVSVNSFFPSKSLSSMKNWDVLIAESNNSFNKFSVTSMPLALIWGLVIIVWKWLVTLPSTKSHFP